MNFFGMGPMEVVVILVVALMIFGPGKLPEVAGQAGKMLRDFKKMTTDLSDEFEKSSGIGDIKKQVEREMAGIQKEVGGVTSGVKKELTSATNTVNSATGKKPAASNKSLPSKPAGSKTTTANGLKTTTSANGTKVTSAAKSTGGSSASKSTSTASNSTTASKAAKPVKVEPPKATKADPLADVSFMDDVLEKAETAPADKAPVAAAKPAAAASASDTTDALARARARRQQAGYARVQA